MKKQTVGPADMLGDRMCRQIFLNTDISSLPVLSVDEFYEQRVAEGWWKPPPATNNALQVFFSKLQTLLLTLCCRTELRIQSWRGV